MLGCLKNTAPALDRAHLLFSSYKYGNCFVPSLANQVSVLPLVRHYAARKGFREKAKKKKVKIEIKKVGFIPHNLREKAIKGPFVSKRLPDDKKPLPVDDVWISRYHSWKIYNFEEALECHRETHHPDIYNQPESPLHVFIELDMKTSKKTKFVGSFSRMAKIPYEFPHGEERSILVFCKTPELKEHAELAGASLVGDVDILKKVEKGDIVLPDFQFVLAHPNILPELAGLRGLLKKKFPSPKLGTLGTDIGSMVKTFRSGVQYWAYKDEIESDYGWIDASIGTLNMETKQLKDNLKALIEDILVMKPKRPGPFITRIMMKSPPSKESFKLGLEGFLPEEETKEESESDSDDEKVVRKN